MASWLINRLRSRIGHERLLDLAVNPGWAVDAWLRRRAQGLCRTRPRVAVLSMWDDAFAELAAVTAPNKAAYCARHGYDWLPFPNQPRAGLAANWGKIPLLLATLPRYDWVMWTDADSVVTNPEVRLEPFLATGADLLITRDHKGLNSGQFIVRRCAWTSHFLESILAAPASGEFLAHLNSIGVTLDSDHFREQRAIQWFLSPYRERRHVRILPQRAMNSYAPGRHESGPGADHAPGDFILHLPGLDQATRLALFKRHLQP